MGGCGPLLRFEVAVVCALNLACFHKHLRRCAIDAFLEACVYMLASPGPYLGAWRGNAPVQDMMVVAVGMSCVVGRVSYCRVAIIY